MSDGPVNRGAGCTEYTRYYTNTHKKCTGRRNVRDASEGSHLSCETSRGEGERTCPSPRQEPEVLQPTSVCSSCGAWGGGGCTTQGRHRGGKCQVPNMQCQAEKSGRTSDMQKVHTAAPCQVLGSHAGCSIGTKDRRQLECSLCCEEELSPATANSKETGTTAPPVRKISELRIMQWNCDSLATKRDKMEELAKREVMHLVLLQENKFGRQDQTPNYKGQEKEWGERHQGWRFVCIICKRGPCLLESPCTHKRYNGRTPLLHPHHQSEAAKSWKPIFTTL